MKEPSPLSDPPMIGSVTGCSMEYQPAPDAGQRPEPATPTSPAATDKKPPSGLNCRYQWVGDRMRERLDAMEKERSDETCLCGDSFSSHTRSYNHSPTSKYPPNCPQLNILDPTPCDHHWVWDSLIPPKGHCARCGERK